MKWKPKFISATCRENKHFINFFEKIKNKL